MAEIIKGLVSTIIPVFNRSNMMLEAVDSVLKQTYRPIEIIISDDGSTDETPLVIERLIGDHPDEIRSVSNKNQGAGRAREAGRLLAQGEFIQYLDSDDLLQSGKFEVQVAALREHPECGVAYCQTRLISADGEVLSAPYKWTGRNFTHLFPALLHDRWWNTQTPLFRRSVCDEIGPWSSLRYSQDWEYDGRVGALGTQLIYCPEILCDTRRHEQARQTNSGKWLEPADQVRFFSLMLSYARQAGVAVEDAEMQHFSRWVFSAARQCGARGYSKEAAQCFHLAMDAAGPERSSERDFQFYQLVAKIFGWKLVGSCSLFADRIRNGSGKETMKLSWMDE